MTAPFDTLKLARRLEAAGIEHKQAGDMAEAIAEATTSADLATKRDLRELGQQLTIRLGGMLVIATGILLAGLGATASIILNRLPPASQSAPAPRAAAFMLAGEAFNWDRYHDRQDTCRELDQAQRACANEWPAACDQAVLARLQRQCSAFGPLALTHHLPAAFADQSVCGGRRADVLCGRLRRAVAAQGGSLARAPP